MTRSQLFTAVFFALLLLLLYQIVLMFRPFLFPILWAALLAQVTFPLHDRLTLLFAAGRCCRLSVSPSFSWPWW